MNERNEALELAICALTFVLLMVAWMALYVGPKDAVLDAATECSGGNRSKWSACIEEAEREHGNVLLVLAGY
jgi:hypothetical protein